MTRIDFYSLEEKSSGNRFLLACRLVERIHETSNRMLIRVADAEQARHMDRLLWTFRQQSFLPHGLIEEADRALTPILISHSGEPDGESQVLINLALDVPPYFGNFDRLCELVDQDPKVRDAGRQRYAYYRAQGHALHHHKVQL